ncbi:MAG: hypothetical protein AB2421_13945 [Thermotaleaceae bacterium]
MKFTTLAGVAIGLGIGVAMVYYFTREDSDIETLSLDMVNRNEIYKWFKNNEELLKTHADHVFVLTDASILDNSIKTSKEVKELFNLNDGENIMVQALYKQSDSSISKCRIIKYRALAEDLSRLLNKTNFFDKKILIVDTGSDSVQEI